MVNIDFPPGLSRRFLYLLAALTELKTIHDAGQPLVVVGASPQTTWGDVIYTTQRGWTITVFNDCGGFDYISDMVAPDGTSVCKLMDWSFMEELGTIYNPDDKELEVVWLWKT